MFCHDKREVRSRSLRYLRWRAGVAILHEHFGRFAKLQAGFVRDQAHRAEVRAKFGIGRPRRLGLSHQEQRALRGTSDGTSASAVRAHGLERPATRLIRSDYPPGWQFEVNYARWLARTFTAVTHC